MKSFVPSNPFDNLRNTEVQYWLGMLITDGSIYESRISLRQNDEEIIKKFQQFLGGQIKIFKVNKNKFKQYCVQFRNKKVVEYLQNLGITENKSFNCNPTFEITFHFLRGIIDGDGSFINKGYQRKCRITTASTEFAYNISNFLFKNNIEHILYKEKTVYRININKQKSLLTLIDFIYRDANTYIKHKYYKAQDIRNYILKKLSNSGNQHQESRAKPDMGRCRDWTATTLTDNADGEGTVQLEKTSC